MAGGWSSDGAVQDQIDDTVKDAVLAVRRGSPQPPPAVRARRIASSAAREIPEARRRALPGARTCVACQSARDARTSAAGINRRGSKDSQLR